jgi:hypothetical protein
MPGASRRIRFEAFPALSLLRPADLPDQVSFFGADGSLIGNATTEQLKAGESISIPALQLSKLVRAVVSIGDVVDPTKSCLLKTRIEIFDVQTGTMFVSVSGDSVGSECSASVRSGTSRRARVRRAQ